MAYISLGECRSLVSEALSHLSSFELHQWWLQPHPDLDGSAPYIAVWDDDKRDVIVRLAQSG